MTSQQQHSQEAEALADSTTSPHTRDVCFSESDVPVLIGSTLRGIYEIDTDRDHERVFVDQFTPRLACAPGDDVFILPQTHCERERL